MDEIAHIEELSLEFVDFDRNKGLTGREWMPYVIKTTYQQVKPYFGLNVEELDEKFGGLVSSVATKVHAADVPVCTTLFLDEVIVEKLYEPEQFLSNQMDALYLRFQLDFITPFFTSIFVTFDNSIISDSLNRLLPPTFSGSG
jgi:hypothetical protein